MKKRYLFIAIPFLIYLYFKFCNRTIPIEFKFEYIKNDSIFFSSNKNLEEYGDKTGVVRYGFICPISNNDLTFPNQTDNEIILEYDPRYYTEKFEHKLLVRKEKNRFFYRTLISIRRNNEIYKPSTVTDKETIELIKQKGESLECKIGVLFYFFPPPKYSNSFFIPTKELLKYIDSNYE